MSDETTTETSEDTAPAADTTDAPEKDASDSKADELGEAGQKALKTERDARKAAEKSLKELTDEVSRLRRSNAASKGTDVDAIKAEIRSEFAAQLGESELKSEAKGRLNDPADALLYITGDNRPQAGDAAAMTAAVDKLLAEKPYLAAKPPASGWGDVGAGPRASSEPEPKSAEDRLRRAYSKSQ